MDMTEAPLAPRAAAQRWRPQVALRLARILRRGERLQRGGWDINIVRRQADDTWLLAGACAALGARELAMALENLHAALATLLAPPHLPQMTMASHLANLHARLGAVTLPPALTQADAAMLVVDEPSHENGFPLQVVPPARYWEHLAARASAPAPTPRPSPSRTAPDLASQLHEALDAGRLELAFQPMLALRDDEDGQFQALLRLQGANGRMHTAAELLPAAAAAGLLAAIDRWVLKRCVVLMAGRHVQQGARRLFASQSSEGLHDAEAATRLAGWLAHHQLPGDAIAVELRAQDVAAAPERGARYAAALAALGVKLALSGYDPDANATAVLAGPAFDFVKLAPQAGVAVATLRTQVDALHERGARVIAPRIEHAQEAALWHAAGADFIQGNFVQAAGAALAFDIAATTL